MFPNSRNYLKTYKTMTKKNNNLGNKLKTPISKLEITKIKKNTVNLEIKMDKPIELPVKFAKKAKKRVKLINRKVKLVSLSKTKEIKKQVNLNKINPSVKEVKSSIPSRLNCKLTLSGLSKESIDEYIKLIAKTINQTSLPAVWLPTKKSRITLLKSPHVNKRAKEHFELKTYKATVKFLSINQFDQINLTTLHKPAGVQVVTH